VGRSRRQGNHSSRQRWRGGAHSRIAANLTLAGALLLGGVAAPARALVPYVYVPPTKELQGAGLGIAQAAARLLRLGQAEDAARLAELTVRLLPDDPRGWLLLAEAQLRSNRISKAQDSLQQAKRLDPNNPGIWFAEGSLALRNNKPSEALNLLRHGLGLDPKNSGAYFDVGNAQVMLGNYGEALASFEKASALRADFWEAVNNQGLVLFESGRTQEAIGRWRRVLRIKPDAAETILALASGLFASAPQDKSEALKLAERALSLDPNYVLPAFQKDQLWGPKLRAVTAKLLAQPALKPAVDRANANASGSSGGDSDNEGP
jgi:cytochrome c-type biogenesis protein CcmH/NrfG